MPRLSIALVLVLALAVSAAAQTVPLLTVAEQARLTPASAARLATCQPLARGTVAHRDVARYRCADGIVALDVFSGAVTTEVPEHLKAKVKRWGWYLLGAIVTGIYLYGHGEQ